MSRSFMCILIEKYAYAIKKTDLLAWVNGPCWRSVAHHDELLHSELMSYLHLLCKQYGVISKDEVFKTSGSFKDYVKTVTHFKDKIALLHEIRLERVKKEFNERLTFNVKLEFLEKQIVSLYKSK